MEEVVKRIDKRLFMKQKEWIAEQVAILESSGEEKYAEGILNLMDQLQDTMEEEYYIQFALEETEEVTEYCSQCEREVTMNWNVKEAGLMAYCPYCGKRLMLCNYCPATDPEVKENCDYCTNTNSCRYNRKVV